MALKKTESTEFGFDVTNAYQRVQNIKLAKTSMAFQVSIYAEIDTVAFKYKNFDCTYDINGENPFKQAYTHLKTLPEFEGAIDC
jgi:hypothetical protein